MCWSGRVYCLSSMDRHVIANRGAEPGATTSVFPSDAAVRDFLRVEDREAGFREPDAPVRRCRAWWDGR
ncbi:hypothetical protein ABZX95_46055 [Streptomyces sp. NPDC004232]|uniref:hypothetical protein n=1 Tax=Streptomyces sp. NPDC004232 TaxID=3154454 RepID=UPI0033AEF4AB